MTVANITTATEIADYSFDDCDSLTSVTIGNSVTSIGKYAFCNCYKLVEVYNLSNLTITAGSEDNGYVGYYAKAVHTSKDEESSIKNVNDFLFMTDENGVNYLVGYVGSDTNITLPDDYNGESYEINQYAFWDCVSLTNITIPDSVTSISAGAFGGCSSLESITLPFVGAKAGVTNWDKYQYPFGYIFGTAGYTGCTRTYQSYYGSSTSSTTYTYYNIPSSLKSVTITGGNILYGAFYNCSNIESVTIGDSVTSIGKSAFYKCTGLTSVTIGEGVTSIGYQAFCNCSSLTTVTIPTSVTLIDSYAFQNCSGLINITIPDSVTSIGDGTFSGCSSLESITIPFIGAKVGVTSSDYYQYPFGHIFGTSSYAGGKAITQYYYCYSTSSTTSSTYYVPSSLKSVTITGGNILYGAFYNCSNIESVTIGDSVTSIGESAFYKCTGLTSVTIGEGVTSISSSAFFGCDSLASVYYEGTFSDWENIEIDLSDNEYLTNAPRYYYSETEPSLNAEGTAYDGNYWHYDTDGVTPVIWTIEN